ncbi:LrgB family protein [Cohnella caldifontis]|uniref:LrgB family protein n=1 Tax=Cohnella caldifontis TaxID=3027471 RepID=UPI0023ECB468|nr:LrgB family protein [Cohnella sp. YIM B05605]
MNALTSQPLFGVAVTVGAYALADWVRRRWWSPLHPLLAASAVLIAFLTLCGIPYDDYDRGGSLVSFFLGPATIALGTVFYQNWPKVRRNAAAILSGVTAGSVFGIGSTACLLWLFGSSKPVLLSMLPKNVTSPVSLEIVARLGGIPPLGAAFTVLAGLLGSVAGPALARLAGIRSDAAIGTAIGTTAHGIGTARLLLYSEAQGSVSGFSMAVAAMLTPLLFIPVYGWLS